MLTYAMLKDAPKDFLCATGLMNDEFLALLRVFSNIYYAQIAHQTADGKPRQRRPGAGAKGLLPAIEDKLLFILVYQKTYPLQTMHGLQFGMSQPEANYWIHRLLPLVKHTLTELGMTPTREAHTLADHPKVVENPADFILDGTERRRQRPQDGAEQTAHYSGKKKTHTDKNLVLVNTQTDQVIYLGPTCPGKTHDKRMADEVEVNYPNGTTVGKDTGFQGYEPRHTVTQQCKKKPKGRALSDADKFLNRILSGVRIRVEHVIAGVKRCRIVKDTFRNTKEDFADLVMEVACALHNLRIAYRHPQPVFNVLRL